MLFVIFCNANEMMNDGQMLEHPEYTQRNQDIDYPGDCSTDYQFKSF